MDNTIERHKIAKNIADVATIRAYRIQKQDLKKIQDFIMLYEVSNKIEQDISLEMFKIIADRAAVTFHIKCIHYELRADRKSNLINLKKKLGDTLGYARLRQNRELVSVIQKEFHLIPDKPVSKAQIYKDFYYRVMQGGLSLGLSIYKSKDFTMNALRLIFDTPKEFKIPAKKDLEITADDLYIRNYNEDIADLMFALGDDSLAAELKDNKEPKGRLINFFGYQLLDY